MLTARAGSLERWSWTQRVWTQGFRASLREAFAGRADREELLSREARGGVDVPDHEPVVGKPAAPVFCARTRAAPHLLVLQAVLGRANEGE